jgi:sucrose-phosphate synthase
LRLLLVFAHDQVFAHNRNGTVTFVCNCYGLTEDQVFVANDTANDIEMLRTHPRAIFVRNFDDELDGLPEIVQAYSVSPEYARGVIEGIDHFCCRTAVPE